MAAQTQTGLRISEITGLDCADIHLGVGAHVTCTSKGRKQITPLGICISPARAAVHVLDPPSGSVILRRQRDDATSHADATRAKLYDEVVRVIDTNRA